MLKKFLIDIFYRPKFVGQILSWAIVSLLMLIVGHLASLSPEVREAIAGSLENLSQFIRVPDEDTALTVGSAIAAILLPFVMALKATLISGAQSNKAANVQGDLGVKQDGNIDVVTRTVARNLTGKGPLARSRRIGPIRLPFVIFLTLSIFFGSAGCTSTEHLRDQATGKIEEWRELYVPVVVFSVHSGLIWFGLGVKKRVTKAGEEAAPITPPSTDPVITQPGNAK